MLGKYNDGLRKLLHASYTDSMSYSSWHSVCTDSLEHLLWFLGSVDRLNLTTGLAFRGVDWQEVAYNQAGARTLMLVYPRERGGSLHIMLISSDGK
jgi:hypothetical protein